MNRRIGFGLCLDSAPSYDRALINLSRGGADATVTREFDLTKREFVKDGFERPEAKVDWIGSIAITVFVYTDFGPGSQTTSGYPRIAKLWKRGTLWRSKGDLRRQARGYVHLGGA